MYNRKSCNKRFRGHGNEIFYFVVIATVQHTTGKFTVQQKNFGGIKHW